MYALILCTLSFCQPNFKTLVEFCMLVMNGIRIDCFLPQQCPHVPVPTYIHSHLYIPGYHTHLYTPTYTYLGTLPHIPTCTYILTHMYIHPVPTCTVAVRADVTQSASKHPPSSTKLRTNSLPRFRSCVSLADNVSPAIVAPSMQISSTTTTNS